jgi:AbrB family looped-hinge helix DNA binding protein
MKREYAVTLSSKGQLTLPAEMRRELELERGVRLRLVVRDDGTVELVRPRFARVADLAGLGQERHVPLTPAEMREQAHIERWQLKQERSR